MGKITKIKKSKCTSRPKIPEKVVIELWSKAGGRCELCNEKLWRDGLTYHQINQSNIAHIIAQTPKGPRGSEQDSERLATDISNLMLVCAKHNKLFDTGDIMKEYSVERLHQLKEKHENRIDIATDITPEQQTTPLVYTSTINNTKMFITDREIRNAVFPHYYPILDKRINLNFELTDMEDDFWIAEKKNLENIFNRKIIPELENGNIKHLSIFAIAPQPLLIYLGFLLGDKYPTEVYQLQRNPRKWGWYESSMQDLEYIITKPDKITQQPVLTLSLSDNITEDRIKNSINGEYSRWDLSIKDPNREFLINKNYLYYFSHKFSKLIDEIKNIHGIDTELKIIPVMPLAIAIELGRRIDPKYSMPIKIYNNNQNTNKFEPVMNICLPKN